MADPFTTEQLSGPVDRLSAYVHIPFCAARCGYCDFNTYTNLHFGQGASAAEFADTLLREIDAARALIEPVAPLRTVFFGGGTPTLLPARDLARILKALGDAFGHPAGEVTTEANPETVTKQYLAELQEAGFTRFSFGMQSARSHVLAVLDRQHTPGQVEAVAGWASELGLEFSVDLIYGAPGESLDDWQASLDAAIALEPGHISAYGLTIEDGTKMGAQVRRGLLPEPDPDVLAAKYEMADDSLTAAGYDWYEVSNWAKPGRQSEHNRAYWTNSNWWGFGPGAHSHIDGVRFWNVKHPIAYSQKLAGRELPIADGEQLNAQERREENIMLGIRLKEGIVIPDNTPAEVVAQLIGDELIEAKAAFAGRIRLTRRGRLLADTVTRALL
ncbi:radical SAM family heme chaperone HemW [Trueperella bialowiezensis]|uniref:Heme chaperone HemW n=1 Tax=Trueperella bialowiezensis TaxID=312285 RepID=A0A3S4WHJ8_9ACTO|nr:radical SAM family heme chaperone HemW [Trueperella bialowiezensis]VEI14104.1 Oxygen-independent coproporphyrinogen-III oxidase [Trueperella bialowiezensis]